LQASSTTSTSPRAQVASSYPIDPPTESGFTRYDGRAPDCPTIMEYVSMIQAHRLRIGNKTSRRRNILVRSDDRLNFALRSAASSARVRFSTCASGRRLRRPWRRPSGRFTAAVCQVIPAASRFPLHPASDCCGKRIPPLAGPRATLCCTR